VFKVNGLGFTAKGCGFRVTVTVRVRVKVRVEGEG
jgi:DNA-directed RNA polymerase subunit RPC12/RpoP